MDTVGASPAVIWSNFYWKMTKLSRTKTKKSFDEAFVEWRYKIIGVRLGMNINVRFMIIDSEI